MPEVSRGRVAANGGMWQERSSVRALVGLLLSFFALACGDERPPWSGFEVFPPDASLPTLSPELEARLQAAAAAFVAPPAAGQGAEPVQAAPDATPAATSSTDAGTEPPPRMAAEGERRPDDSPAAPRAMPDAGVQPETPPKPPARRAAAGARSFPPRWPFDLDASIGLGRTDRPSEPDDGDAGTAEPAADGGG